jgi:hypothetical protein
MTRPRRKPYRGELQEPIDLFLPSAEFGKVVDDSNAHVWEESTYKKLVAHAYIKKMDFLLTHYGIDRNCDAATLWFQLALRLARDSVPGFRFRYRKKPRGRSKIWDHPRLLSLVFIIDEVKQQHDLNDRAACRFICNTEPYATDWGRPGASREQRRKWIETLESRLQEARHYHRMLDEMMSRLQQAGPGDPMLYEIAARVERERP